MLLHPVRLSNSSKFKNVLYDERNLQLNRLVQPTLTTNEGKTSVKKYLFILNLNIQDCL